MSEINFVALAKAYSKAGYSVIPVGCMKTPTIREWRQYQNKPMTEEECEKHFHNANGMALICGGKHSLTALDLDIKNDFSGDLYERVKKKIPVEILKKFFVQKTQNGGYHFVFSCPEVIENNQKFASRFTTADERHQVYIENFENPLTKDKALKIANNHNHIVLLESRGCGGYILIAPTPGYEKIYGNIGVLTKEEYYIVLDVMRSFNEVSKVVKKDSRMNTKDDEWKLSPFEDYNQRADIIHLLEMNGWKSMNSHGRSIRLKRPGKSSTSSALFDTTTRIFTCFSTSSSFDPNKGYNCSMVLCHLEHGDDFGKTYQYLIENNYGIRK